jgi:predicted RNA-binding protein YlqC (UPF0109 family)
MGLLNRNTDAEELKEKIRDVVTEIIKNIVDNPKAVKIEKRDSDTDDRGVRYFITVDKDDVGKVLGRKGNTINAVRRVADAMAQAAFRPKVNLTEELDSFDGKKD